jgi:2-dehydropantoate 2-reductase
MASDGFVTVSERRSIGADIAGQYRKGAMRTLVVGTGGVGGYYGARLKEAGHDVPFLARSWNLEALRNKGLTLRSDLGDVEFHNVEASEKAEGPVDVALICVKTYDNDSAAAAMDGAVEEGTLLVSLQNGVDNERFWGDRFPAGTVIAGTARIVAWLEEPGVVIQRGPDVGVALGTFDDADLPKAEELGKAFREAGIQVGVSTDARAALWLKLAGIVSVGTITAYGRCTIGEAFDSPELSKLMEEAAREAEAVARAQGIALPPGAPDAILGYARAMIQDFNSSMARDLEAGRPLEIEALSGAVVRDGEDVGVPTPANQTFLDALLPIHREALARRNRGSSRSRQPTT